MSNATLKILAAVSALAIGGGAHAADVTRAYPTPTARLATSATVPAGTDLVYLSGAAVPPAATAAPADRTTEAQTDAVLKILEKGLKDQGLSLADVVNMHVYLVGDPAKGGVMDFAGMNAAYARAFGTADQPNRPTRTTVQVVALAAPGALVEIDVVAAHARAH